jgi:hypothetical protein
MMHTYSAAVIKSKIAPTNHKPREGTKTRALYDLFYDNKGKVIDFCSTNSKDAVYLPQLTDVYGLDIRRIKKNKWCLVGEWFGKIYVDYTQP